MNHLSVILLVCLLIFSGCQRKTSSATEESKPAAQATPAEPLQKPSLKDKELRYKEIAPLNKEALMKLPISGTSQPDYKTLYESGYQKHNAGDFQGAISDFSKCIIQNPEFSEAWNFRGMAKYKSGDNAGACSDWKRAAELGNSQSQSTLKQYCK